MTSEDKLHPGRVLGRYELLLPIAQGGMATVWAARQKGSRGFAKTVAVKAMLPNLSEDPMFEKMFLDEAALAARIHHPNVAEILDLGEEDEILYIVMEWIDGEALSVIHKAARKANAGLPLRIVCKIAVQACQGLHAAHEMRDDNDEPVGLVHRDVSPQNILVTNDGLVKMVDFGVAKATSRSGGTETNAGQLKGKVPYMSPEQARGNPVDRRTDIFAMGIVLYKLTTGLHPFLGDTDLVTLRNIISRPLLPPRVKNPSYSAEMEQVLMKCLQKDPEKRYQTMAELVMALEKVLPTTHGEEDDVASFVRGLLGDRGAKRRAALKEAVRAADLRAGHPPMDLTGVHPRVVPPTVLDDTTAPPSMVTGPTSLVSTSPTEPPPNVAPPESVPVPSVKTKRRTGVVFALGAIVVAAGTFVGLRALRTTPPPVVAVSPVPSAEPHATASPEIPVAATTPIADAASPSSAPIGVIDPPPVAEDPKKPTGARPLGRPLGRPLPSSSPSSSPKPPPGWTPTVTNPGF